MAAAEKEREAMGHENADTALIGRSTKDNKRKNGISYTVRLLDGTDTDIQVSQKAVGRELFECVCDYLNLMERDYFCCSYLDDSNTRFWLLLDKPISSQMNHRRPLLYFEVKFYPIEPNTMRDEQTRYLLFLQLRLDILMGKLPCSFVTHQLLGSYVVQSDLGDYDPDEHGADIAYIKDMQFAPRQSDELLEKIVKLHAMNRGQSAPEAELHYLENAKLLAFYGVDLHQAVVKQGKPPQDVNGTVNISVSSFGISVYVDQLNVYRWPWIKIIQFTYNRTGFVIKIRPDSPSGKAPTYKYKMRYEMAKRLWQSAVEHHAFFRLSKPVDQERAQFPKVGARFRYDGRTQKQIQGLPDSMRPAPTIHRGGATRFLGRGLNDPVNTTGTGYSTDRAENYYVDDQRTNTLTLGDRRRAPGYAPGYGGSDGGDSTMASHVPMAGYEEEDSRVALLSGSAVGYSTGSRGPNESYLSAADTSGYGQQTTTTTTVKQTTVNVVMSANKNGPEGDEMLPPYQEDQQLTALLRPKGKDTMVMSPTGLAATGWGASRQSKTSSRTYTDTDGNVITEYTLERDGVIEKRVEKRTVVEEGEDDFDHDKALLEAIRNVTDMNQDLSVEKIEIQTTAERV